MHAKNQGVRGAEPPDAGIFLKTVHFRYLKFPIFLGSVGKFVGKNFFLLLKISFGVLLLYYILLGLGMQISAFK